MKNYLFRALAVVAAVILAIWLMGLVNLPTPIPAALVLAILLCSTVGLLTEEEV